MNLEDVQDALRDIIGALPSLATVEANIILDGINAKKLSEDAVKKDGISIIVLAPRGVELRDQTLQASVINYAVPVLMRTDPAKMTGPARTWNPLKLEGEINAAVRSETLGPGNTHFRFFKSGGEELLPQPWPADAGLDSRIVYYALVVKT